jgi:hypothetical protein
LCSCFEMRIASYSYWWLYLWTESTSPQLQELVVVFARLLHEETGIGPSYPEFNSVSCGAILHYRALVCVRVWTTSVWTGTRVDHHGPILNSHCKCPMTASQWLLETLCFLAYQRKPSSRGCLVVLRMFIPRGLIKLNPQKINVLFLGQSKDRLSLQDGMTWFMCHDVFLCVHITYMFISFAI